MILVVKPEAGHNSCLSSPGLLVLGPLVQNKSECARAIVNTGAIVPSLPGLLGFGVFTQKSNR
jgi:hypothetical protein